MNPPESCTASLAAGHQRSTDHWPCMAGAMSNIKYIEHDMNVLVTEVKHTYLATPLYLFGRIYSLEYRLLKMGSIALKKKLYMYLYWLGNSYS